jgi:hypothetical protein
MSGEIAGERAAAKAASARLLGLAASAASLPLDEIIPMTDARV